MSIHEPPRQPQEFGNAWHGALDGAWAGPGLEELLDHLLAEPKSLLEVAPEELSADAAVDYLVELQQAQSRLADLEARALVVAAGAHEQSREVLVVDELTDEERILRLADVQREEIAAALHRSPTSVHESLTIARLLNGPLQRTATALREGHISAQHARCIVNSARRFSESTIAWVQAPHEDTPAQARQRARFTHLCGRLQDRVLPHAVRKTVSQTARIARAAVAAIDVEGEQARRERARTTIDVRVSPDDDGLALLRAWLPIEDAARVHAAIDARARSANAHCGSTLGQLRVQGLIDAICGTSATAPTAVAVRAEINVVIDAAALIGMVDCPGTIDLGPHSAEPISAQAIRELLGNPECPATLRRLITDPVTGTLLDRGRSSYAVSDSLRAFLVARDRTCRHPGCTRPACTCQIDHATAWSDGGRTDRENAGPLCTRHHQCKTHADWQIIESRKDGSVVWRSPAGRIYEFEPPPLIPAPEPAKPPPVVHDGPPFPF